MTDEQLKAIEAVAEAGRTLDAARIACGQAAETVNAAHSNYDDAAAKADKSVPYGENPSLFILESGEAVCVAGSTYYIPAARVTDLRPAAPCAACEAKDAEIKRLKDATPAMPMVEQLAEAITKGVGNWGGSLDESGNIIRSTGSCYLNPIEVAQLARSALKRLPSPLPSRRLTGEDVIAVAEEVADKLGLAKPNPKPSDAFYVEVAERLNAVMFTPREVVEIPPDKRRETLKPGMQVTGIYSRWSYRVEVVSVHDDYWLDSEGKRWGYDEHGGEYGLYLGWLTAEEIASVMGATA